MARQTHRNARRYTQRLAERCKTDRRTKWRKDSQTKEKEKDRQILRSGTWRKIQIATTPQSYRHKQKKETNKQTEINRYLVRPKHKTYVSVLTDTNGLTSKMTDKKTDRPTKRQTQDFRLRWLTLLLLRQDKSHWWILGGSSHLWPGTLIFFSWSEKHISVRTKRIGLASFLIDIDTVIGD